MKRHYALAISLALLILLTACTDTFHGDAPKNPGNCNDGIDNDGDGRCDFPTGQSWCTDGSLVGDTDCTNKWDVERSNACVPEQEVCDGKDNDCDTLIDEDDVCLPETLPAPQITATQTTGELQAEITADCTQYAEQCEVKRTTPIPERTITSNAVSGKTYYDTYIEGDTTYTYQTRYWASGKESPTATDTITIQDPCECRGNSCEEGNTGNLCNGCTYVTAPAETCDGTDNNCDGVIDEGCQPSTREDLFTDTFETADFSTTNNGFDWQVPNRVSIVRDDGCVVNNGQPITNCGYMERKWENGPGVAGHHSMRFRYPANTNMAEQRWTIPQDAPKKELWISYWWRVPLNFQHPGGTNNQKFMALWMDEYEYKGAGPTITWQFRSDGNGGSNIVIYHVGTDVGQSQRHSGESVGGHLITVPDDRGRWMHIVHHVVASTDAQNPNGVIQTWRRWEGEATYTQLLDVNDAQTHPPVTGPDGFRAGYLMGWANAAYSEDTEFLLDDFTLGMTDPRTTTPTEPSICECAGTSCAPGNTGLVCDGCNFITAPTETCDGTDNNCDGVVDEGCTTVTPNAPILQSATYNNGYQLSWTLTNTEEPLGGYDVFIDGTDTNADHRGSQTTRTITGLDTTVQHCFQIQARWLQLEPDEFYTSNEKCVAPPVTCTPTTEVCDGKDNDCDGQIDELSSCDGSSITPLFTDSFETGDVSHTTNGFHWSPSSKVSTENPRTGDYSMRFEFGPDAYPGGMSTSEQRFNHNPIKEYWMEYYVYYPDGTEGWSARYFHRWPERANTNNKFLAWWGESYQGKPRGVFQTWVNSKTSGDSRIDLCRSMGDNDNLCRYPSGASKDFIVGGGDRGRWIQFRFHVRVADYEQYNGLFQAWKDGELLIDVQNDSFWDTTNAGNYLRNGYLLGWSNSGFNEKTVIHIDDFTFYDKDPGWDPSPAESPSVEPTGAFMTADFDSGTAGSQCIGSDALATANTKSVYSIAQRVGSTGMSCQNTISPGTNYFGGEYRLEGEVIGDGDDIWMRQGLYFPGNACWSCGDTPGDCWGAVKWMRVEFGRNTGWVGPRLTLQLGGVGKHCNGNPYLWGATREYDGNVNFRAPTTKIITRDEWHYIQWHVHLGDDSNGYLEFWLDDTYLGRTNGRTMPTLGLPIDFIKYGDYWNGGPFEELSWYTDDIIFTTQTPSTKDSGGRPYISPNTRA